MVGRGPVALEVDLGREVVDAAAAGVSWFRSPVETLYQLEEALRRGTGDRKISALLLKVDSPWIGWSKAESLFRAIQRFRGAGKPTVAFLARAGNAAYMVASSCEAVLMEPGSTVDLQSLSSESFFFKDLLGELGIHAELDRVGEFKSAAEMFERRESSESHRSQIDSILSDVHDLLVRRLAEGRSIPADAAADALRRGPFLPEEALQRGLGDGIGDERAARKLLEEKLGRPPSFVSPRRYLAKGALLRRLLRWRRPRIAIVHATGVITAGESRYRALGPRAVGARGLVEVLSGLRERKRVKAVVVRVDSPGGGAQASDRLRRELRAISADKPVVVSMGDVAASGGYFIATAAHLVLAESSTLTGSIGVVGGKFVVQRLLDRLGVHHETRATGENAGFHSPLRSFTSEERARHQQFLRHFYERNFLPAVAEGRRLTLEQSDAVGRGRVWTGRQALERGLIDRLGGLPEAIDLACERAGIARERARITFHSPRRRFRERFGLSAQAAKAAFEDLGPLVRFAQAASVWEELVREEILLLLPGFLRIR